MPPLIEVKNVYKHFNYWEERPDDFKKILVQILSAKFNLGKKREISVLEDVSFNIFPGDFVGIMGRNGVGKSTILRLISGIYIPNRGEIKIHGKVAPLIELGAGFVGDLSGHENIFINSAILGYSRKQILTQINQIIDFSELGEKIFMPIKNYSSGMLVRLGFSIAAHLDAPLLFFDEVLGVGDAGFQEKCLAKIKEIAGGSRAIVLVTHNAQQVIDHCNRCLVFNERKLIFDGDALTGANYYTSLFHHGSSVHPHQDVQNHQA